MPTPKPRPSPWSCWRCPLACWRSSTYWSAGAADTMSSAVAIHGASQAFAARGEPALVRWLLIGSALTVVGIFIVAPVVLVFYLALEHGVGVYWNSLLH